MDYVLEADIRGRMVPRKIGMAPVMREGIEFEFTTVFDGDLEHFVTVSKDRTGLFTDQRFQVTKETGIKLLNWLNSAPETVNAVEPPPPTEPVLSVQDRLQAALYGLHDDWITDFLIDRKQIAAGGSVLDLSEKYCESALERITDFRKAIVDFGTDHDRIP